MKTLKKKGIAKVAFSMIIILLGWNETVLGQQQQIQKKEVPKSVIQAIESDYMSCKENISWYVSESNVTPSEYFVTAKGKGITCESHYDGNGRLLWAKTVLIDTKIPGPVLQAISTKYPDWKITGDRAVIHDFDENTKKFEVAVTKGGQKQYLYYSASGNELKHVNYEDFPRARTDRDQVPASVASAIDSDYQSCQGEISWYVDPHHADEYLAKASGRNMSCEARYDKSGNLIEAKTVKTNVKLPEGILNTIAEDYPGWKITGDQEIIHNFDISQKYYNITIARNGETKTLHYNAAGKEVKPIM